MTINWCNVSNSVESETPWAPSQYPKRRLSVRSRKVSKPRDLYLELSDRSEIWQALRQQCCRCACQISKRYDNLKYQSRGFETLRDLKKDVFSDIETGPCSLQSGVKYRVDMAYEYTQLWWAIPVGNQYGHSVPCHTCRTPSTPLLYREYNWNRFSLFQYRSDRSVDFDRPNCNKYTRISYMIILFVFNCTLCRF